MGENIDGKAIAKKVREEVRLRAESFTSRYGRAPCLEVILVGDDPASQVYVRSKERAAAKCGLKGGVLRLAAETSQADLLAEVARLNDDPEVDGILVQLPLPKHLDAQSLLDGLAPEKDVDGLHPMSAGLLAVGRPGLRPCTPSGCMRLLDEVGCDIQGLSALVVGRSDLVGKPIAQMLLQRHATVTIAHSRTRDLAERVRQADIVVAAVGRPELIRGEWIKPGAIVLDVGINRTEEGKLIGDVEFEAAKERAAFITPVPGGVGPMTIAMLLGNTVNAAEAREA